MPPDNNRAERSLRPAVTKRNVCGGARSMERFRETAGLLSIIQTYRLQGRSAVQFFCDALSATVSPTASPSSLHLNSYESSMPIQVLFQYVSTTSPKVY